MKSVKLNVTNELIKEACNLSMNAHDSQYYLTKTKKHGAGSSSSSSSAVAIFAFKGPMKVDDLYNDDHFGETKVDYDLFPSLQRIGEGQLAKVNGSVLQIFINLLTNSGFKLEVKKAEDDGKKILLTGHSNGGAVASLATLWMLDEYTRKQKSEVPIGCVTFGSPLIGDGTVTHAVRREKWADRFTHFVMERDIVPRMMLAPKTSIQEYLPDILSYYQQKVNPATTQKSRKLSIFSKKNTPAETTDHDQLLDEKQAEGFFENVLINASTVASHDAFDLMESTNSLKEALSADFVKVSPYRPFGYYVFCTRDNPSTSRQLLVVKNPNAVLQLLFYFLQLPNEDQNLAQFALESLTENLSYKEELNNNRLQLDKSVDLKDLNKDLLKSDGSSGDVVCTKNKALFELTASAKWCLLAVEEAEKRKKNNMDQLTITKTQNLSNISKYKEKCGVRNLDYYEAFKLQTERDDFEANVNRLEQAKIWDVVIEMVLRKDLPDEFEASDEWVVLGTRFRRLYEPLDIANYYRHSKGDDTGVKYMDVRPKRYKFTQRWYQHANVTGFEPKSESNFVAEVEELINAKNKTVEQVREDFMSIKNKVDVWTSDNNIANEDVFWGESVLSKLQEKLAQAN